MSTRSGLGGKMTGRSSAPVARSFLRLCGIMASVGMVAPAFAQPGDKPISKPATPPAVDPAPQPAGQITPPSDGESKPKEPTFDDGKQYPVSRFVLRFLYNNPGHPPIEEVESAQITLAQGPNGYIRPRDGLPTVTMKLGDIADRPVEVYCGSAIDVVIEAIVKKLNEVGIVGVYIATSADDVKQSDNRRDPEFGKDLRPQGKTELHLDVFTGTVSQVRSLASGDRIPFEARIDHPAHKKIRERSPVQPATSQEDPARKDLIRKDQIDDYLYRLNRHPGRRVDVALTSGEDVTAPDGAKIPSVSLDYLVAENKPWTLYFQVSNTGTKQTNEWRERFGFVHNQLTGRDDTLTLDYVTAGFDASHAFIASYEAPVFDMERLRFRVFGTWSEFDASDVGAANGRFSGDSWSAGGELIWNVYQHKDWFVDLVGGFKWQDVSVTNDLSATSGDSPFALPYLGARLERFTDTASTTISANFEFNAPDLAGTDSDLNPLGRNGADDSFTTFQWDATQSFYLEPLIARAKWLDTENGSPTLAHEMALTFKGQYAFDQRLIPNFEQVAGGLYTVRGYPESAVAGDGVIIGSAEYRFHLPKAMKWNAQSGEAFGKPFRWVPQQPYGSADWDLILRGFFDAGRTIVSDAPNAEKEETLLGTGIGAEFIFKRNFNLRIDWGIALEDADSVGISAGSNRFHIVATFLF